MLDAALVDKTYDALLTVVQTTALSRKVLRRPPFTFLHKLLVETLADYDIFTYKQLEFVELVTKEDKAAFLTRAIAFVAFAMATINSRRISCLLLVSPIKVLAGVAVEDTHEFLLQLCDVCKSPDREAKDAAAHDVVAKGDAQLYTSGVSFRKGLLLVQAIVRSFIKRRARKRKALENGVVTESFGSSFGSPSAVPMAQGARFLKELADGRVYDGVVRNVTNHKIYVLGYEQDPAARDEVDEIEMKTIMEESQRLSHLRERLATKPSVDDADTDVLLLTGLPDLSLPDALDRQQLRPRLVKRVSARDASVSLAPSKSKSTLSRSQSSALTAAAVYAPQHLTTTKSLQQLPEGAHHSNGDVTNSSSRHVDKPWQASLKRMLASGQDAIELGGAAGSSVTPGTPLSGLRKPSVLDALPNDAVTARPTTSNNTLQLPQPIVSFPKLGIPGTKSLAPMIRPTAKKRLHPDKAAAVSAAVDTTKGLSKSKSQQITSRSAAISSSSSATELNTPKDVAFSGVVYQTSDQKTQEKLALFREIVRRIDVYMKRKHLRVIDLFRFCDADGNGSISPLEMLDTMSQMDIQLSTDEAQDFITYIDKDGNGSIDIDEFEELVRVARRNEAQREQLRKEQLSHSKREAAAAASSSKTTSKCSAVVKHRQRICDAFQTADIDHVGVLSASHLRSLLVRMELPGVDLRQIDKLLQVASQQTSVPPHRPSTPSSTSSSSISSADPTTSISFTQLCESLDDLEWRKRPTNRFLDPSWVAQFDNQMDRAVRELALL